ncbi:uncharacterized protein LOC125478694 [Pyrus x bretschneideri]|uniref:uncharacterized protein LOC125478694 n=1 Tax=Pyrus x bretschneideri TaxID=225117 RepID=UPI002030D35E|nr:uncharacterized protein LOC125478694 [Pyrus x bretschneideri]
MLNNGYLCCTVRGDLVRMFADLVNKKKGKFDHIVIETMGTKFFCNVLFARIRDWQIQHRSFKHFMTDLVGKPEIASLVQQIKTINRMAQLKRTEFGKVNLDYVLGIGGFDLERIESAMDDEGEKEDHEHRHDHHHDHDEKHDHNHGSKGLGSKKVHFEAIWGTFGHGLDN